jgi:antitoxin MazE
LVVRAAELCADEKARLTVVGGCVITTTIRDRMPSLKERLANFDPARHAGQTLATDDRVGAETRRCGGIEGRGYPTGVMLSGLEWGQI